MIPTVTYEEVQVPYKVLRNSPTTALVLSLPNPPHRLSRFPS
jgi:hypothetical protein